MNSLVLNKGRALVEGFPTVSALVGFLTSMDFAVSIDCGVATESFPTFLTLKRLLARVDSGMDTES